MENTNTLTFGEMNLLLELLANSEKSDHNGDLRGIYQKIQLQMSAKVHA